MLYTCYIIPLLVATVVLADYYIDDANTSVVYAMSPSGIQSGQPWKGLSVSTEQLVLQLSNSTGSYSITLDASNCYDQNYTRELSALGVCGTNDNCYIEMPFRGSGITMYAFNAGLSGMAASFSVDGGSPITNSITGPTSSENYQVSNVSIYDIQGLPSSNHTIRMTILDWDGSRTSMKFDYAHVNESFVAEQASTASTASATTVSKSTLQASTQTPSQTFTGSSSSNGKTNVGVIVGATLGGTVASATLVIGFFYFCKRRTSSQETFVPQTTYRVDPFTKHLATRTLPSQPLDVPHPIQLLDEGANVPPLTRSAILRDAHAVRVGRPSTDPIQCSQSTSSVLQPLRRHPSRSAERDPHVSSNRSHGAELSFPFSDTAIAARHSLTSNQLDVIHQLRADSVPAEIILQVIEGFASSQPAGGETSAGMGARAESIFSSAPPPSYQTRDR